jgi:tetratricopeptide (TPR) repeat protein
LYNNEHERAVDVLDDALIIAKKNNDISGIAGIKNCYGVIYQNWGRYEQAISNFEEALEIRAKEKNLQEEAKVLNGIGQNYVALNNFEKSFECYNRSLDIKRELDDKNGIAISLANMSINYRRCGDYAKAIEYSNEAMELFDDLNNLLFKSRMKMNLGLYQVFVGYIDEAKKNLKESLKFLLDIDDFKSLGMCYRGLGLVELNNKNWTKAQNAFKKALAAHQKAEHRPAFEGTTLFLGLSYYYDENYDESEKYINKSVQITSMRKNISFYGTTAITAQLMLNSKISKCKELDVDNLIKKIEKSIKSEKNSESAWMAREYWYISESYSNLSLNKKAELYRKKSNKHLKSVSLLISDKNIREDYIKLPLLHQLITGKKIDSPLSKVKKQESIIKQHKEKQDSSSDLLFAFCPNCGFNNTNQFKFCPQCGNSLIN